MPQAAVGLRRCRRAPCERGAWRPEADHNLGPFEPKHPRSRRARRPGIPGAPASHWPCAPADRRRRRLLRRVPGTCIFPVVAAAPAMSPADALTGKGHVRYSPAFSTGLADPQEVDQRSPTSSCAQNSQICTALVFIGIEPAPAQNGGSSTRFVAYGRSRSATALTSRRLLTGERRFRRAIPGHRPGSGLVVMRHPAGTGLPLLLGGADQHLIDCHVPRPGNDVGDRSAMSSAAIRCPNWARMLSSTSGRLWPAMLRRGGARLDQ